MHSSEAPSAANAFDIFRGEWNTAVPGFDTGHALLFDDPRLKWLGRKLGGFSGRAVLEIGPLECGHTFLMEKRGAVVTAIESNTKAFLKCLVVKNALHLNAAIMYGDAVRYLKTCRNKFDFVLASGVLYHLTEPAAFLHDIAQVTDAIGIWTHYYDEKRADIAERFISERQTAAGREIEVFRQSYKAEALVIPGFCGGAASTSCWLSKAALIDYLCGMGFSVEIGEDDPNHQNGPCLLLFARRR